MEGLVIFTDNFEEIQQAIEMNTKPPAPDYYHAPMQFRGVDVKRWWFAKDRNEEPVINVLFYGEESPYSFRKTDILEKQLREAFLTDKILPPESFS